MSSPALVRPLNPPRLDWMDPAKAVAIGLVIFYHAQGYSNIVSRSRADAGVDAFLLLSGFGLAYAAKVEPTWRFLTRRVWRLLPAYWLVLALIVLVNHFRGLPIDAKQVWYHVACVHLIIGDPYTLGISDSLWFIGLIVPLYFIYAALRPWVARDAITLPELDADGKPSDRAGAGYALLALAAMVAAVAGWYLQLHYKSWGPMALGHAPNRLPAFFVGAIAGLIARRREPLAGVVGRPMLLLGLTGTAAVALVYGWAGPPLFTIAGSAAIGIAVVVTQASRRWKLLRPTVLLLAGLGAMSYELFLCHQYVMRWIGDSFVLPYVSLHKPRYTNEARALSATLIGLAAGVPIAYAVRWVIAFKQSRADWRRTLTVTLAATVGLAVAGAVLPGKLPSARTRKAQLIVEVPSAASPGVRADPVLSFGSEQAADLVFVERDPAGGRARFGVRHWGDAPVLSEWSAVESLSKDPWVITVVEAYIQVQAGGQVIRSRYAPYDWRARFNIAENPYGFDNAYEQATIPVRRK